MKTLILVFSLLLPTLVWGQTRTVGVDTAGTGKLTTPTNFYAATIGVGYGISAIPTNFGGAFWGMHITYQANGPLLQPRTVFIATNGFNVGVLEHRESPYSNVVSGITDGLIDWENNFTVQILPGRYVLPDGGFTDGGVITLEACTNIVISGYGATLKAGGLGTMWHVKNTTNITFEGITFEGVLTNDTIAGPCAALWFDGVNSDIQFKDCIFKQWPNKGIANNIAGDGLVKRYKVSNCQFSWIGSTNTVGVIAFDGACLDGMGTDSTFEGNYFHNCLRPLESYALDGSDLIQFNGNRVINNFFDGSILSDITIYSTNNAGWLISGNRSKFYSTNATESALRAFITMSHLKNSIISGNTIEGAQEGVNYLTDSEWGTEGVQILGNSFSNITSRCITIGKGSAVSGGNTINGIIIANNIFNKIGYNGIYSGIDQGSILNNVFIDCGYDSTTFAIEHGTPEFTAATNMVIANNMIYNSRAANAYTDGGVTNGSIGYQTRVMENYVGPGIPVVFNNAGTVRNYTPSLKLQNVVAASVLAFDFNVCHRFVQTNRMTAATTVVLTNSLEGEVMSGMILGEVAGGTSRVVTFVSHTGQLIQDVGDYTTGLATSLAKTVTNGLSMVWSVEVLKMNGTNTLHFANAYYKN